MRGSMTLAVMLTMFSATAVAAQEPVDTLPAPTWSEAKEVVEKSGLEAAVDSIAVTTVPELEEAIERLTGTLDLLVRRIANDPELRTSALRTAGGLIVLTERVIAEQSEVLLDVLRTAEEEISKATVREGSEPNVRK